MSARRQEGAARPRRRVAVRPAARAADPSLITRTGGAVALAVAATAVFATMHALVRHVSAGVHPFEVAFFRSLFGLLAVAPLVLRAGPAVLLSHRPKLVILRGVCSAVSLLCWFYGLSVVPIATATALSFTNVIFGSVGVALILGEPMRGRRWLAVGLGFLGMLLIVRPGVGAVDRGTLIVLLSAVLWGASTVIVKEISRTDGTLTIVVWAAITLTVATAVPALMVWRWPSASELLWLALIGTLASLGTLAWTYALKTAEATLIIPLDFLRLVWAGAIGFFVFVELPGAWTWAGSALIVASTVYIAMPQPRAPTRA